MVEEQEGSRRKGADGLGFFLFTDEYPFGWVCWICCCCCPNPASISNNRRSSSIEASPSKYTRRDEYSTKRWVVNGRERERERERMADSSTHTTV
jgi:hypothetical protein